MAIGYACKLLGVRDANTKTCIAKNATEENLYFIIEYNLKILKNILEYNAEKNIHLFRISSDIIPFGSSPVNALPWWDIFKNKLVELGLFAKKHSIRLSMHPGQYTVLNSPNGDVVNRAIDDLIYHTKFLDSMQLSLENKIILHIGGAYGNKPTAIQRFKENYVLLPQAVKQRLIIENDDKIYNIEEVLDISKACNIPVVFDNLHHKINQPPQNNKTEFEWIEICKKTWSITDGIQKIHYSQQAENKKIGSHSSFIYAKEFIDFYQKLNRADIDIMLEVKDKNLSCIKCMNITTSKLSIKELENEWSKYKYTVLEHSPNNYQTIRNLLKDKEHTNPIKFYELIEQSLDTPISSGITINALQHVWGYFKKIATEKEKEKFVKLIAEFKEEKIKLILIKNYLEKLSQKYNQQYLLNSYYFFL